MRADLLAVAAQDVEDRLSRCPLFRRPSPGRRFLGNRVRAVAPGAFGGRPRGSVDTTASRGAIPSARRFRPYNPTSQLALTPGTRLGVYEITAQIGEGGMGEVYRATDTKLKRQVAIKVLPPSLAVDADRLARFQREAEVLASLNHPNIAAIYGLEDSGGRDARS